MKKIPYWWKKLGTVLLQTIQGDYMEENRNIL